MLLKNFLVLFFFMVYLNAGSGLDRIILPEIKDDPFYYDIYDLSKNSSIKTILEIGSSSGDGSTEAFVKGIKLNPNSPILYCIEISNTRFAALKKRYENNPSVKCYHVSSIRLEDFPSEDLFTGLLLDWLKQDIAYVKSSGVPQDGIRLIKKENHIYTFDMVLIDGSEFTGKPEFDLIYGAKFILLDDIFGYKNHDNYIKLLNDQNYFLLKENLLLRNGYAIFEKRGL